MKRGSGAPRRTSRHDGMRIFFIGFMGSGKTTVGTEVARRLGLEFVDLDQEIERRAGRSIADIFARQGETEFRRLEEEELGGLSEREGVVVATGGGCFASPTNRSRIRELGGISVWLDVPMSGILDRMSEASRQRRPLLRDLERAQRLYESRRPSYSEADHRIVLEGDEEPTEVVDRVVDLLRS